MRRLLAWLVASLATSLVLVVLPAEPAAAEAGYSAPVDGEVVDGWRPPTTPFGAGNRGVDLAADPGEQVRASADGEVVFAGRIGLDHHVVVLHPDGIRTSYSFLASVAVARGDPVVRGDVVGEAGDGGSVHFGARAGDRYVDPALLLGGGEPPEVRLIPVEERAPQSEGRERLGLVRGLVGLARAGWSAGEAAVAWMGEAAGQVYDDVAAEIDRWVVMVTAANHFLMAPFEALQQLHRGLEYWRDQRGCTPGDAPPPPPPRERRIAVLVGGYGSASGDAAVLDVDTEALGYADGDVAQLSYAGGQAEGRRTLAGVTTTSYGPDDTRQGIDDAAERLRGLLQEIRRAHPGVPVDVIAHSQGGIVALSALEEGDPLDPRMPEVGTVVTLGTPHDGTELATFGSVASRSGYTEDLAVLAEADNASVDDLSETSEFMEGYRRRPLPEGVRVASVAASGDLVVPATHSALPGDATNAIVDLDGVTAHDRLPGSEEAHREVALALAGMGPTCRSVWGDVLGATGISLVEDLAGAVFSAPAVWFEAKGTVPKGSTRSPGWPQPRGAKPAEAAGR